VGAFLGSCDCDPGGHGWICGVMFEKG
jgi:hypothetical protein